MYNQETDKVLTATVDNPNPSALNRTSTSQLLCKCLQKIDIFFCSLRYRFSTFWDEVFLGHVGIKSKLYSRPVLFTMDIAVHKSGNKKKSFQTRISIRIFLNANIFHASTKTLATFQHCQTLCPSRGIRSSISS